jgi:hypothetical protein
MRQQYRADALMRIPMLAVQVLIAKKFIFAPAVHMSPAV